jgi:uncharacterized protein (DUF1697 family)
MPSPKRSPTSCVALLRGINVGGKNIIPMAALRGSFEQMGFSSVRTLIASGNVVFQAAERDPRRLERRLDDELSARHGYGAKVVVRTAGEYERMMRAMPEGWGSERGLRFYVLFLRAAIDRPSVLGELEVKEGIEELRYVPGALLWSARLDGLTQSKMRKVMTKAIYQDMTVRNVNTVRKLYDMLKAPVARGS